MNIDTPMAILPPPPLAAGYEIDSLSARLYGFLLDEFVVGNLSLLFVGILNLGFILFYILADSSVIAVFLINNLLL